MLSAAISVNSQSTYASGWRAFNRFRQQSLSSPLHVPASVNEICQFVAWLSLKGMSPSTISTYMSSVSYVHKLSGWDDPTKEFVVSKLVEGARRLRPGNDARLPISLPLLQILISALPIVCSSQFEAVLFKAVFLSAYFGFMRVSEFAVLSKSPPFDAVLSFQDVTFSQSINSSQSGSVVIQLRKSKNNQRGLPQSIRLVQSQGNPLCPVSALLLFSSVRPRIAGPFFCHFDGSPLTQYQFHAVLRKVLVHLGLEGTRITSHSFRIGAASSASHLGVALDDVQSLGRWRSNAFLSYIRPLPFLPH